MTSIGNATNYLANYLYGATPTANANQPIWAKNAAVGVPASDPVDDRSPTPISSSTPPLSNNVISILIDDQAQQTTGGSPLSYLTDSDRSLIKAATGDTVTGNEI